MKKLLFAFIGLAGFAATAMPEIVTESNYETVLQEKQYKKIQVSDIKPEAMEKIKKGYGQYTVKEAYRADDGEYKLILSKDGVDITATFTPAGDLIKILS